MGISIPEEKITDALITAYMKHRRGPEGDLIWQEHFQELADILIKHGIVSPPADVELDDDGSIRRDTDGVPIIAPAGKTSSMWHSMHWRGER